jgi:hypothetical protein
MPSNCHSCLQKWNRRVSTVLLLYDIRLIYIDYGQSGVGSTLSCPAEKPVFAPYHTFVEFLATSGAELVPKMIIYSGLSWERNLVDLSYQARSQLEYLLSLTAIFILFFNLSRHRDNTANSLLLIYLLLNIHNPLLILFDAVKNPLTWNNAYK